MVFITLGEVEVMVPACSSDSKGSKRLFDINENLQGLTLTLSLTGVLRNSWAVADTTCSTTTSLKPGLPPAPEQEPTANTEEGLRWNKQAAVVVTGVPDYSSDPLKKFAIPFGLDFLQRLPRHIYLQHKSSNDNSHGYPHLSKTSKLPSSLF